MRTWRWSCGADLVSHVGLGWRHLELISFAKGIMSSLLLEIVNVYPALSPPSLTAHASNRVCNALALLQCVASHSETRSLFLNGEYLARYRDND